MSGVFLPGWAISRYSEETNHGKCACGRYVVSDQYSYVDRQWDAFKHTRTSCARMDTESSP